MSPVSRFQMTWLHPKKSLNFYCNVFESTSIVVKYIHFESMRIIVRSSKLLHLKEKSNVTLSIRRLSFSSRSTFDDGVNKAIKERRKPIV